MNYEKKYKEALEIARKINSGEGVAAPPDWTSYEVIFPELKESEDERIRKGLIKAVSGTLKGNTLYGTDVTREEALDWLEKQGEQKKVSIWKHWKNGIAGNGEGKLIYLTKVGNTYNLSSVLSCECDYIQLSELDNLMLEKQGEKATHINGEDCGINGLYHAIKILERTVGRVTGYQSDDGILSHEAAIDAVKELYKKQGGQEHFYDFNANDWYVSKVDGKIHNMTYNPTDKVKPEFKVGDCVVNNNSGSVCQVTKIRDDKYCLWPIYSEIQGYLRIIDVDTDYHLWTIADAKDGDVLVNGSNIFIFHFINDTRLMGYCHVNIDDGRFYDDLGKNECFCLIDAVVNPATKEQRDLLFQKMKEAGYEWDADKKELKKIEQKKVDANKVIEWLKNNGWCTVGGPKVEMAQINKFKKDFGL